MTSDWHERFGESGTADLTLTGFRKQSHVRTAALEPTFTAILDAVR
jgi:hypothetical protein